MLLLPVAPPSFSGFEELTMMLHLQGAMTLGQQPSLQSVNSPIPDHFLLINPRLES